MSATASEAPKDDTALGRAIAKVADPDLQKVLSREVALLRDSRSFGLVFDRHLPESARLPQHPIGRGLTVVRRDDAGDTIRTVVDIAEGVATLDDGSTSPVAELVAFRDFGDPVYPGLRSVERIDRGAAAAPCHTVINGENLHALQILRQTHGGAVDLIYIDPPYNTGNEGWIYNDKYVDANDRARSSKWLSFMERRLTIARSLLKPTGVIIVAIGDDEHHRLRMLMDQVFGGGNFISDLIWQGSGKNDAKFTAGGVDYMPVYARDLAALVESDVRWREVKPGLAAVAELAAEASAKSPGDPVAATRAYRTSLRSLRGSLEPSVFRYDQIDEDGRVFQADNLSSPNLRVNLKYEIYHPATGRAVKMPHNGWRFSQESMAKLILEGRILFGVDETTGPRLKRYLDDQLDRVPYPTFTQPRMPGSRRLETILGDRRFPFPKDHEVLMRWIRLAAPDNAVVLDFFGGSGTTTEAVMRLNAEDGGTRQSILVTNNEVGAKKAKELRKDGHHPGDPEWEAFGVFEYVTRPRISTVVTGERPDGSTYSDGLEANVEMFDLTYLEPGEVRRGREFAAVAPILWIDAGASGARIDEEPDCGWALVEKYGVLFDVDALKPFADAVTERAKADDLPGLIFVVTDSPTDLRLVIERLPVGCKVRRLYESHIDRFTLSVDGDNA